MTIKIYTKKNCPFCVKAKRLLNSKGLAFEEIDLELNPEEKQPLIERTNYRKVPQIFINDEFIGGFTELQMKNVNGELDEV